MTIASLAVEVFANTARIQSDVNKIQGSLDSVGSMASKLGTLMAGAFTVTAITGAAHQILDYAGKVADLSAQTGLTTKTIQEMQHAATLTGASLENFTNAAFKLGVNIAGGGSSVVSSLEKLGLSYAAIRAMAPDEQFNVITTALGHVENAQDRNKLAVDLFGKAAKEILPAIAQGYDTIQHSAIVAGDAQIHALDAAGDALDSFWEGIKSGAVSAAGSLLMVAKKFDDLDLSVQRNKITSWDWGSVLEAAGLKAQWFPKAMDEMRVQASNLPQPLQAVSISVEEQEIRMKALEAQHKLTTVSTKGLSTAQVEVDANLQRLTDSFNRQIETFKRQNTIQNTVYDSFRLMRVEFTEAIPVLQNLATNGFEPFKAAVKASGQAAETFGQKLRSGLMNELEKIPQTLASAFTGGGGIMGALQSTLSSLGSWVGGVLGFSIGGPLGKSIGSAIGSLTGTIIDPLKRLFGFGVSAAAEAAAKAAKEASEKLLIAMQTQLAGFRSDLAGLISKGAELGYVFDQAGNVVSVKFDKMRDVAGKYGTDLASLGPAFQSARLGEMAGNLINDFWLLVHGGADVGAVLSSMSPQISQLVTDSMKFGTDIPENMKPWILELQRAGLLTDANGVKIDDLTALKFGAPVATEFEKITAQIATLVGKMQELIDKIALNLSPVIDMATRDRTIHIGYQVDAPPDIPDFMGGNVGGNGPDWGGAQATGGDYFVTRPTLFLAGEAGPERASFSGANQGMSGGGDQVLLLKQMIRGLPRAIGLAVSDAMVLSGARR